MFLDSSTLCVVDAAGRIVRERSFGDAVEQPNRNVAASASQGTIRSNHHAPRVYIGGTSPSLPTPIRVAVSV